MKKKILLLSMICVLSMTLCACANSADTTNSKTTSQTISDDSAAKAASPVAETLSTEDQSTTVANADTAELSTLVFDMPEDFIETEENYYCSKDSTKVSNINYLELPNDSSFNTVNADVLLAAMEPQLESIYGIDLTFTLVDEEFFNIADYQAFRYTFEYMIGDETITQLQCIIDTPSILQCLTYTTINSEDYLDAFNNSIQSLRFE